MCLLCQYVSSEVIVSPALRHYVVFRVTLDSQNILFYVVTTEISTMNKTTQLLE